MISKNKIALITGAESGIGKSTAKIFADNGYQVIGTCLKKVKNKNIRNIEYYQIDISNYLEWKKLFSHIGKKYKKINSTSYASTFSLFFQRKTSSYGYL